MRNRASTSSGCNPINPPKNVPADSAGNLRHNLFGHQLRDREVFLLLLAFRTFNGILVYTYFNPDEYWQSLEVAHRLVFGYASLCSSLHTYLTRRPNAHVYVFWLSAGMVT
eukprot:2546424-Pyramimonas_sp.AAC.1